MPLEARPLEVLGGYPIFLELLGEGQTIDRQAAELVPVVRKAATQVVLGFREKGAVISRLGWLSRTEPIRRGRGRWG